MSGYRYIHTFRIVLDHLEDAARYGAVFVSELYSNRLVPVYPGQENYYAQDTSILILNDHGSFGTVESISVPVFSLLFPLPGNTDNSLLHQKDSRYYPGMSRIIGSSIGF